MEIIRRIKDWHQPWKKDSEPSRSTLLEVLEPRILLSVDGLLNVTIFDQGQDTSQDSAREVVQYAELLDTNEQVEEHISPELAPSDTPNIDVYHPIFTLFVDDDNTNDESIDADLSIDNIGSAQVNKIAVHSDDFDKEIKNKVVTTEDGSMPT